MRVVNENIKLHEESIKYVNETLSRYVENNEFPTKVTNPIFHMYPTHDTYNESGTLDGYIDALFVDIHIYDTKEMTVYKCTNKDAIMPSGNLNVSQIKVFKDGSTMIVLHGTYYLSNFQAISVYSEEEYKKYFSGRVYQ